MLPVMHTIKPWGYLHSEASIPCLRSSLCSVDL